MEELQDAIEDAQYMNAMQDTVPKPTKEWKKPTPEEIQKYKNRVLADNPKALEAEGICTGSLGFYMFLKYITDQGLVNMSRFLFDVAAFRSKISANISSVALKICNDYLVPGSEGNPSCNEARRPDIVRVLTVPKKKHPPTGPYPGRSAGDASPTRANASSGSAGSSQPPTAAVPNSATATGASNNGSGSAAVANAVVPNADAAASASASVATTVNINGNQNGNHQNNSTGASADIQLFATQTSQSAIANIPVAASINQVVPIDNNFEALTSPNSSAAAVAGTSSSSNKPSKWANVIVEHDAAAEADILNAIRCTGEPVEAILATIKDPASITNYLFDELDIIVFSYLNDKHFENFRNSDYYSKFIHFMAMTEQPVTEDDFALFRVLGRGGFGMVSGCKRCYSGRLFAMKVMNKKRVKMKKAEALCLNERNILSAVDSPFVVCLKYAFTTSTDLYLVLDLMIGGDLGYHLQRRHCFKLNETRFYAARILLGIAALHDLSIVYRDLKPENVLMDEYGYTKISDLGLACKVSRSGLSGTCGTRGYWAPEMLRRDAQGKRERYSLSVDWFSFGCCIYEFLVGVSPFRTEAAKNYGKFPKVDKADKDKAIDLAILEMDPDLEGSVFDDCTKDLLRKLLIKDGRARLGARGYREIMMHPWFADIDFDSLNQVSPPVVPPRDINMAPQSEIGSFVDDRQSRKIVLSEADHKNYESWLFISTRAFQEEVVEFLLMEDLLGPIRPVGYVQTCCCVVS